MLYCSFLDPPRVTPSFGATDNITESGTPYKLQCTVESNPKPDISWYFNGKIHDRNISEAVIELTDYKSVVQSTLSFPNGVTRENHGLYTCNATNKLGIDSRTVEINVWRKYLSCSNNDAIQQFFIPYVAFLVKAHMLPPAYKPDQNH